MPEKIESILMERPPVVVCRCLQSPETVGVASARWTGPRVVLRPDVHVGSYKGTCHECGAVYSMHASGVREISLAERADALAAIGG